VPLGQANSAGPQAEMPVQHCAVIFLFLISFNISEIHINFKNA
jgi:hypothetical protein